MKIRLQIAFWMMGVGSLSILIFVMFVFTELQEAYIEMVHTEAKHLAKQVTVELHHAKGAELQKHLIQITKHEWVRIEDSKGHLIYLSPAARNHPWRLPKRGKSLTHAGKAYVLAYPATGKTTVYAAWEMSTLASEEREMQVALIGGLLLAMIFLVGSSYFVADRILQPVRNINQLAQEITVQRLDQRIPLGQSRDELFELSQSLNLMFDRIERGMQQQRQFLSDASHELKTPTAMLRLFLEQLEQYQAFPDELRSRLEGQTQGLLRMERLIKQLLELSVFESREQLPLAELDLLPLLQSLLIEFEPLLEAQHIQLRLELSSDFVMRGHAESLRRVLICLLENAILYNHPGGQIEISSCQAGQQLLLKISNTGPGIPAADLPHIFERFYRVNKARTQANSGSGLGLAIVQQILRLHQGSVKIDSQPGAWTSVHLIFSAKS